MNEPTTKNIAETIFEETKKFADFHIVHSPELSGSMNDPFLMLAPAGMQLHDLTAKWREAAEFFGPLRMRGTATLTDLASFIAWANRFKDSDSALFACMGPQPSLTAVIDYNREQLWTGIEDVNSDTGEIIQLEASPAPSARHGLHRGHYAFPVSKEWKLWSQADGTAMSRAEFGEFFEGNAKDLLDPTPALLNPDTVKEMQPWEERMRLVAQQLQGRFGQYAALVQLARAFQVHETSNLTTTLNRDTGESSIQFLDEHRGPDGQPLRIPNLFMIAIPIFEEGALYRIPVRFRYRKSGQDVKFLISLHNADVSFRDAVREAFTEAEEKTGLPLFLGQPEAARG